MARKISKTQRWALTDLATHDLIRPPGGYWARADWNCDLAQVGSWVGTRTIYALESRGLVTITRTPAPRDHRRAVARITDAGRDAGKVAS